MEEGIGRQVASAWRAILGNEDDGCSLGMRRVAACTSVRPMTRAFARPRHLNISEPACVITKIVWRVRERDTDCIKPGKIFTAMEHPVRKPCSRHVCTAEVKIIT
jgi:hypothetical protein